MRMRKEVLPRRTAHDIKSNASDTLPTLPTTELLIDQAPGIRSRGLLQESWMLDGVHGCCDPGTDKAPPAG